MNDDNDCGFKKEKNQKHMTIKMKAKSLFKNKIKVNDKNILEYFDDKSLQLSKLCHEVLHCFELWIIWKYNIDKKAPFEPFKAVNLTTFLKNIANYLIREKVGDKRIILEPTFKEFFDFEYSKLENRPSFKDYDIGSYFLLFETDALSTIIKNNWTFPFENRLKNILKVIGFNKDRRLAYDMTMTIFNHFEGWNPLLPKEKDQPQEKRVFTEKEKLTITDIRKIMGFKDKEKFSEKWFQSNENVHHAINTHLYLLNELSNITKEERKIQMKKGFKYITMFPLIPKRSFAHSHMQISSYHLKNHLYKYFEKDISESLTQIWKDKKVKIPSDSELWLLFFGLNSMKELTKICKVTGKYTFANSIKTDGTYVSILFEDKNEKDELPKYKRKKKISNGNETKVPLLNIKKQILKLENVYCSDPVQLDLFDWIGIDPGRNDLLHCYNYNTNESFNLSKLEYRSQSGITQNNKWWDRYFEKNFVVLEDGTQQSLRKFTSQLSSFKTIDFQEYKANLELKWKYNDQLWELLCPTKRRAHKFAVYGNKKKVVDQFYQKMIKKCKKPPIFCFGDASFSANSKNELPGPTKELLKIAKKHAPVFKTNEYLTSQVCYYCVSQGCDCSEKKLDHPKREKLLKESKKERLERKNQGLNYFPQFGIKKLHNVVWCKTNYKHNYMKRDLNSAKNIVWIALQTLKTCQRPKSFCPNVDISITPNNSSKKQKLIPMAI